jgi:hypothetical protein
MLEGQIDIDNIKFSHVFQRSTVSGIDMDNPEFPDKPGLEDDLSGDARSHVRRRRGRQINDGSFHILAASFITRNQ